MRKWYDCRWSRRVHDTITFALSQLSQFISNCHSVCSKIIADAIHSFFKCTTQAPFLTTQWIVWTDRICHALTDSFQFVQLQMISSMICDIAISASLVYYKIFYYCLTSSPLQNGLCPPATRRFISKRGCASKASYLPTLCCMISSSRINRC
jgi:hypothetical protein